MQLINQSAPAFISGPVMVAKGATLAAADAGANIYRFSGPVAGAGRLLVDGGVGLEALDLGIALVELTTNSQSRLTLTGDCSANDVILRKAIDGGGSLTVHGATTIEAADLRDGTDLTLLGPTTIETMTAEAPGTITFGADTVLPGFISGDATIIIDEGVTFTLDDASDFQAGPDSVNLGTLVKLGASEAQLSRISGGGLANHGLVRVLEGSIHDLTIATHVGEVEIAAGATYATTTASFHTADAKMTGEGTFEVRSNASPAPGPAHHGFIDVGFVDVRDWLEIGGTVHADGGNFQGAELRGEGTVTVDDASLVILELRESVVLHLAETASLTGQCSRFDDARLRVAGTLDWTAGNIGSLGLIEILPGGSLHCSGGNDCGSPFHDQGTIVVDGSGTTRFILTATSQNDGLIDLAGATAHFWQGAPPQGPDGILRFSGGVGLDPNGTTLVVTDGRVEGESLCDDGLESVDATVAPGLALGELPVNGDYVQGSCAVLEIQLGGPEPGVSHDQLAVSGSAILAGTLRIEHVEGFVPSPGNTFTILSASDVTGAFNRVVGPGS